MYLFNYIVFYMKFSSLKFSNIIELEKKKRRFTNNQTLADSIGISINTIQNIMKGQTKPSIEILCTVAVYTEHSLEDFFDYSENELHHIHTDVYSKEKTSEDEWIKSRFEKVLEENGALKYRVEVLTKELEQYKSIRPEGYTMPDVSLSIVAEAPPKLKK